MGKLLAQIVAEICTRVPISLKTQSISLVWMKNADHLLFFANMIAGFFVGLTHLVTALNTFNDIDIIFTPHGQRILRGRMGILRPR